MRQKPSQVQVKIVRNKPEDWPSLILNMRYPENAQEGQNVLLTPSITGLYLRARGLDFVIKVSKEAYDLLDALGPNALFEQNK
jgi:hypothetical protein